MAFASEVIARRVGLMMTGQMIGPYAIEMVTEKFSALSMSMAAATGAAMTTGDLMLATRAGMAPFESRLAENIERLRG